MSLTKYDNYKDSGVDWLGDIPSHWEVKRVKDIILKIGSGVTPKGGSDVYKNKGIPFIRSQNVYNKGLKMDTVSYIDDAIHERMKNSKIRPFDILINITGASIGRTCFVPSSIETANINQHIIYMRIAKKLVYFISRYFQSKRFQEHIMSIQLGTSKEALNMGQTLSIPILLPPLQEQQQIANYLDKQTTIIDKKITLLQTKIEHYKALKKSLINETVCRGLDKAVVLKDSGIEWIGDIPEHWEVERLKDYVFFQKGINSAKYTQGYVKDSKNIGLYPVYSGQTGNKGVMGKINTFEYDMNNKVILVTTVGAKAMTSRLISGKFSLSQNCALITSPYNIDYYFHYLTQLFDIEKYIIPSYMQPSLRIEDLKIYNIITPPLQEQQQIANYLDEQTQKIDKIVSNLQSQIERLGELRQSLINEVVTGKVCVVDKV